MKNTNTKNIFTRFNKILLSIIFIISSSINIFAQYEPNKEFGVLVGTGYYIGDMNSTHFNNLHVAGGLTYRVNFDRRFSFKSAALYTNIYADDANSSDPIKKNRNLHFKSEIIELSGQLEFNFLPYETGNSLYSWSPFVFIGAAIYNHNPKAEALDGQWYDLQKLGTEGQGTTTFANRKKYALTQLSMPFGGGVKIGVSENFNIILEYGLRKTSTDYLDDVSMTYAGIPTEFDNLTIELSDRSLDGPQSAGIARGDETNNDWYSFSGITLSFRLQGNTKGCNY
ncbi:MAG: DUF6089 family protein [Flavobacteriales bacterium]|nr:DUF6089 family protein [Flavobacteriales bacterium]|tara:strand:- start:164 stop:1012 length:849 start_codon:yes stop_codon:yes gene_type:complete